MENHELLGKTKSTLRISSNVYDENLNLLLFFGENYIKDKLNVPEEKWNNLTSKNNTVELAIILFAKQLFRNNIKDKHNNDFTPILDKLIQSLLIRIERSE